MKFVNFAVVKFSVFLILGILAAHYFPVESNLLFYIPLVLFAILIVIYFSEKKKLSPSPFLAIATFAFFFFIGFSNYTLRLPKFQKNHYSSIISETSEEYKLLQLKISELLKPDRFNHKFIAKMEAIDGKTYEGKVLLNLQKESATFLPKVDDVLLLSARLEEIPKSLNPDQFEYKDYMETLDVYGQIRFSETDIIIHKKGENTLLGRAENLRQSAISKLENTAIKPRQLSILQALVLGERRSIDKKLYEQYAAAGAVHILAVSGLHVGVLYFIFLFLLKPLNRTKYGRIAQKIIVIIALWSFAIFTGLSPSVTRAVTMFSFFAFAELIDRRTSTINTLFLSLLVLLLWNPKWLFHVGFQLSYLAVFFIVWMQPKLFSYWYPKNYFVRKAWAIFTVTIAAQLGVIPLSLYYFHQFPGLFIITNLVILPWLGLLLGLGLLVVMLAFFQLLPKLLAVVYNELVLWLNNFIGWVAGQDDFLFKDLSFSLGNTLTLYVLIVSAVMLWKDFSYRRIVFCLVSICLFTGSLIRDKKEFSSNNLIVFHKSRTTFIASKENSNLTVFSLDSVSATIENEYPLKSYGVANAIDSFSLKPLPKFFKFKNRNILVIDSLGVFPPQKKIDIVLLMQSPKVNLERLIDEVSPKLIVADGNNYKSFVGRWAKTCEKKKLPFHYTGAKGAFLLE